MIMTISNQTSIAEASKAFTSHPNLDLGSDIGSYDFEGRLLSDFEGSLTFNEYEINVSYNLEFHEELSILDIVQELWLAEDEASIIVTYQTGVESLALTGAKKRGAVIVQYEGERIMQITAEMPNEKYVFVRDESHADGIAPIFKPSAH
jgi:hypothetical protein